jgi:hypothetical protein
VEVSDPKLCKNGAFCVVNVPSPTSERGVDTIAGTASKTTAATSKQLPLSGPGTITTTNGDFKGGPPRTFSAQGGSGTSTLSPNINKNNNPDISGITGGGGGGSNNNPSTDVGGSSKGGGSVGEFSAKGSSYIII